MEQNTEWVIELKPAGHVTVLRRPGFDSEGYCKSVQMMDCTYDELMHLRTLLSGLPELGRIVHWATIGRQCNT